MNHDDFKNSPSGRLVPTIDKSFAFVPNPLPPPNLDLARLSGRLAEASRALGELSGVGITLEEPDILIWPFSRAEAVASSKIEGTVTPTPELLVFELSPEGAPARSDTREVNNYNEALKYGLQRINQLPFSKRLFNELHKILLNDVGPERGARHVPGELRKEQNWIGGRTIQLARYVPPTPDESLNALDQLEIFTNISDSNIDFLIRLALIHYQFEAIHPYPDGNGRVGRLIIPILLGEKNMMSRPLLYMSAYFETHYDRYIDLMFGVSKTGAWHEWIEFFLDGIIASSRSAINKVKLLQELRREYLRRIQSARSSVLLANSVDSLFRVPATAVPYTARELNVSYNSAKSNLQRLCDLKILTSSSVFRGTKWFFADEIMKITRADDT